MSRSIRFAGRLKAHLAQWAPANGIAPEMLEVRGGRRSLVLTREHQATNLFDPAWWRLIEGKAHRFARALNSSQCFAVNLFGPLIDDGELAARVARRLLGDDLVPDGATARFALEHTPREAPAWLGERGQPTQVDAFAEIALPDGRRRAWLIEVKLAEAEFGGCRGALPVTRRGRNPDPSRCADGAAVLQAPASQCWLVEAEGRTYWDAVRDRGGSFRVPDLPAGEPCPFREGTYQLMRNRALADCLVSRGGFEHALVSACVHPDNDAAEALREPVLGESTVPAAFRRLTAPGTFTMLDPLALVSTVETAGGAPTGWAAWVRGKYLLHDKIHSQAASALVAIRKKA